VAVERVEVVLKMLLVKQETHQERVEEIIHQERVEEIIHQERVEEIIHLGKSELNPCNTQA